jgi:hypothetical protein
LNDATGKRQIGKPMATTPAATRHDPTLPERRNPKLLAIGVLCVVLGGLGTAFAFLSATDTVEVLAFARAVAVGQQISATDITTVRINTGTGLAVVGANQYSAVVGAQALHSATLGSLVNPDNIGTVPQPADTVVVGLRLPYGRLPNAGLQVGDALLLVVTPDEREVWYDTNGVADVSDVSDPAASAETSEETYVETPESEAGEAGVDTADGETDADPTVTATVATAPQLLSDGNSWVLDIWVGRDDAALVARMSAAERLVLVETGGQ